eukprot:CAMPEP_0185027264 /NCGR_PEP_ID=MMETSP1103-20130426/12087_1 /TAXON_ID=36769 /ORGANISM="Paraphysomonas bandaiensis, Strain Caron Lab Isolate" /LENGTH=272 /DNA_ID=CAMNT_0027561167 /DNA_START=263 /DNA_END=1081 /DNA_ORIENTATION=-
MLLPDKQRELCLMEEGCHFDPDEWFHRCKPRHMEKVRDESGSNLAKGQVIVAEKETEGEKKKYALLLEDDSKSPVVAIEVMMKESITSSVADSIVKSHEAAHQVSKALIIELLQNEENVHTLGIILRNCFSSEPVLGPVRWLSYYYLHTDATLENILWQLEWQRSWFFRGPGKVYTEAELMRLFLWWSQQEGFRQVVHPLVVWALEQQEAAVVPASDAAAQAIKYNEGYAAECFVWLAGNYLKSEEAKDAVKSGITKMLQKHHSPDPPDTVK